MPSGMRVGILGSGLMGGKLGTIFARAGHEVVFSYARSEQKLKRLARDARRNARAGTPGEAAQRSGRALAGRALVPSRRCAETGRRPVGQGHRELLASDECRQHRNSSSPTPRRARRSSQGRFRRLGSSPPSTPCRAKCFSACSKPGARPARPSLVYCGDDAGSKEIAAELIRDVGFDPVDAGPLRIARYTEPFALLVGAARVRGKGGPGTGVPVRAVWEMRAFQRHRRACLAGTGRS